MSKRFIEIQKQFPPVPLSANESLILQQYEKSVEESMKRNDIKGVMQNPPYPYYKKQCWKRLQWMDVDIQIKVDSLHKHAKSFLQRYSKSNNTEDFDRYVQLITIVQTYKKYGISEEMIASILCARNPISKKIFPYETGKIWIMDAVKYGFIDDFLDIEKRLTPLQRKTHDNIIQQKLHLYSEE